MNISCVCLLSQAPVFLTVSSVIPSCPFRTPRRDISTNQLPEQPSTMPIFQHTPETVERTFDFAPQHNCLSTDSDGPFVLCIACRCDSDVPAVACRFHIVCTPSTHYGHYQCFFQPCANQKNPNGLRATVPFLGPTEPPLDATSPKGIPRY